MQNPQVLRDKTEMEKKRTESVKRAKLNKRQEREDSMMEHWKSIYQPKVGFGDKGWTNSVAGKRGRKQEDGVA